MPVPVFDQPVIKEEKKEEPKPVKQKISGWAIFLSMLFVAALVTLGEFGFKDSNRLFNPYYESCRVKSEVTYPYFTQKAGLDELCDVEKYERIRLILHADVAIPLILLSVLIYFLARGKKLSSQVKVIYYSYFIFVLWIAVRIVSETEYFLLQHVEVLGKYFVILSVAIIFSYLIFIIQKRFSKRKVP